MVFIPISALGVMEVARERLQTHALGKAAVIADERGMLRFRLHPRMSRARQFPPLKKYEAFAGLVRRRGCRLVVEEEVVVEDAAVAVAVEDDRFEGGTTRVALRDARDHTIAEH